MKIINWLIVWFLDTFGERSLSSNYLGHGDFEEERGWWLWGKWISAEKHGKYSADDSL